MSYISLFFISIFGIMIFEDKQYAMQNDEGAHTNS